MAQDGLLQGKLPPPPPLNWRLHLEKNSPRLIFASVRLRLGSGLTRTSRTRSPPSTTPSSRTPVLEDPEVRQVVPREAWTLRP